MGEDFSCLLGGESAFLIVFTTLLPINQKPISIMSKPSKCITVDKARELQDNWVATRAVDIERAMGSNDTREFLFSLEELQEFLDYVRAESKKQEITNPGVRIYFGAYDNDTTDKATCFLAPTVGINSGAPNNYKIDPFNTVIGGWPPHSY
ncbi:MAG: hypothetical protein CL527_00100 [Aequorivita sp.]|uniref:Uncharacterized protein n=2 Tax=Aequorivita vladivostokensis TaxID=171194 RepID=A0ABR5DJE9_9FLAO|nr:hypothetical protein MB09_05545 [Aequorivita vladivostokensis]MAB57431.1 hypothetical protein [Aequorivita sp.]MAO47134.1 hypothetical protein [Aequorivita sp.]MBF30710.1 hypothetical protein [Aequorivita sp.]MDX1782958.1 hypothetical protein [Aequorivita vladivostokensis]|tara:strand:- start:69403 stop:69855 length:453 start_codon:yes stop_codon:yes gene_type:complete